MNQTGKQLTKLNIFSLKGVQMRTFHTTWLMFFVCFFGWFGLAPLMPTIRAELHLTKGQVGNTIIASVAATIIARLIIGKLCDTWGPRKTAVRLLLVGCLPVFLVGLSARLYFLPAVQIGYWRYRRIVCNYPVSYIYDVCTKYKRYCKRGNRWLG
jgi:nitrate/nitrite transporter NarK